LKLGDLKGALLVTEFAMRDGDELVNSLEMYFHQN